MLKSLLNLCKVIISIIFKVFIIFIIFIILLIFLIFIILIIFQFSTYFSNMLSLAEETLFETSDVPLREWVHDSWKTTLPSITKVSIFGQTLTPSNILSTNCSAWLKLNPKTGLNHHHHHHSTPPHPTPPQTFQLLLDTLRSWIAQALTRPIWFRWLTVTVTFVQQQEYLSCYWPDFDKTLKVASLDHI